MRTRASASSDSTADETAEEAIDLVGKFGLRPGAGLFNVIFRIMLLEIPSTSSHTNRPPNESY